MVLAATPLPANPFSPVREPESHLAYERCLRLESLNQAATVERSICARILGYLLDHAKRTDKVEAIRNMWEDINECTTDEQVVALGVYYRTYLLQTFLRADLRSPQPSYHSSDQEFAHDLDAGPYHTAVATRQLNHRTAQKHAFQRDGHTCMLTATQATSLIDEHPEKWNGGRTEYLHAVHIIPESINTNLAHDRDSIRRVISMFGDPEMLQELEGSNIHRLENVMTLSGTAHGKWGGLRLWLEPMPDEQKYKVEWARIFDVSPEVPTEISFTQAPSTADSALPLPDRRYLALRAMVARVAHLSGAERWIRNYYERVQDTYVLSSGGSIDDAELLSTRLKLAALRPVCE
ncbi:hypothetical protein EXIGLDRAFT_726115 [Exidia glandulosa HHB12029]|uniref:HNH nuclease domain-containing protein n=1 Tax=Exidia glandulosa HHB12029 TaxID=1314781 RepID=A0A165DVI8_EXIGL|nr:hypothetical protein EXIGLDRAFT_726115 [Exidia glandulosa HHB12029]